MPRFRYSAYDASGRLQQGEAEAASLKALLGQLHKQGLHPFETAEATGETGARVPWWQREVFAGRGLPHAGLRLLTRELAVLLGADIPLDEALRLVILQSPSGRMRSVMDGVLKRVLDGASLSKALAGEPGAFPEYYVSMIAAGEASGTLPAVLDDLAHHLERSVEVRARLISTLTYPLILIAMALVAVGIILGVLVPALLPVFEDAGAAPPLAFQVFAGAREILIGNWPVLLTGLAAITLVWLVAMSQPGPRLLRDRLWLRLPLLGSLATASETARITRMLAVLLRSGVPLVGALGIGRGVVRNRAMQAALDDAAARIREGSGLAEALGAAGLFPPLAMRLVTVGEQSGQLERMLGHVAQIHEIDVQRRIDRIMGLLTPALTIAIGLGVGIMIMAVMNAILSVNEITFQ